MSRVQELISVLAEKEVIARGAIAKAHRSCKICGESAIYFRTPRAALEYSISMICQSCQDYYFSNNQ
jgi:phosphoribosyl-dephospho-CoA transferase